MASGSDNDTLTRVRAGCEGGVSEKALTLTQSDRNWLASQIRDAGRKADDDKKRFCESLMRIMERSEAEADARLNAILDEFLKCTYDVTPYEDSVIVWDGYQPVSTRLGCPILGKALFKRMAERASPNPPPEPPEATD